MLPRRTQHGQNPSKRRQVFQEMNHTQCENPRSCVFHLFFIISNTKTYFAAPGNTRLPPKSSHFGEQHVVAPLESEFFAKFGLKNS